MPTISPSSTFEGFSPEFAAGLAGTLLGVRIRDGAGADFLARTTAGITEDTTVGATAVYRKSFTGPSTQGQYWIVWDDGTTIGDPQELVVTATAPVGTSSTLYVTTAELKSSLSLSDQSYADDDIDLACEAASRAIDENCGRRFYSASETRYYSGYGDCVIIDDLLSLDNDEVLVDSSGFGSFPTSWAVGTSFDLLPYNNPLKNKPYDTIQIRPNSGLVFPPYPRNVKIEGTFGWDAVPSEVRQYAKILAAKLLLRSRQAPFGILSYGLDQPIAVRIARHDPDFERLLGHLVTVRMFI